MNILDTTEILSFSGKGLILQLLLFRLKIVTQIGHCGVPAMVQWVKNLTEV